MALSGTAAGTTAARSPWTVPRDGWWAAIKRAYAEVGDDNVGLIAAGTAFYTFASIVPVLAATVLVYGLVADAQTVEASIRSLFDVLPAEAARLTGQQLATVVGTSDGKKGLGLILAVGIALYGGTKASGAMVTALNIAYEAKEDRGFVKTTALNLAIVVAAVLLILSAIAVTGVLAFLERLMPGAPGIVLGLVRIAAYLILAVFTVTAVACLYRYAPARDGAKWAWLTPGSVAATLLWLAGTAGFGFYAANFGNYGATYGSLSAVIVLLTWLWLSVYVFLLGAELNSELERQTVAPTAKDGSKPGREEGAPTLGDTDGSRAPGVPATAVQIGAASRLGGRKAGMAPTLLTGFGLATLRRGRAAGAGLVVMGAVAAWMGRDRTPPKVGPRAP